VWDNNGGRQLRHCYVKFAHHGETNNITIRLTNRIPGTTYAPYAPCMATPLDVCSCVEGS